MPASSRPGRRQVAADGRATGEDDGVELRPQLLGRQVAVLAAADLDAGDEPGALGAHLVQPPVEHGLLHLELGDAVAEQAADAVGPLEDGHVVPGAGELLGGGQPGRAGADDGDLLAGALRRRLRLDPALVVGAVDDLPLDLLDRHRRLLQVQHAGALARRGAQLPGELREVVRRVQPLDGVAASRRGGRGRSTPGSGSPPGRRGGRTGCRSPCSGPPACAPPPSGRRVLAVLRGRGRRPSSP